MVKLPKMFYGTMTHGEPYLEQFETVDDAMNNYGAPDILEIGKYELTEIIKIRVNHESLTAGDAKEAADE